MLKAPQIEAYTAWFQPIDSGPISQIQSLIAGLTQAKDERDAKLQILTMTQAMKMSPSYLVRMIGEEITAEPDGRVADFMFKLHAKLANPIDLAVFIHSPAGRNAVAEALPTFYSKIQSPRPRSKQLRVV